MAAYQSRIPRPHTAASKPSPKTPSKPSSSKFGFGGSGRRGTSDGNDSGARHGHAYHGKAPISKPSTASRPSRPHQTPSELADPFVPFSNADDDDETSTIILTPALQYPSAIHSYPLHKPTNSHLPTPRNQRTRNQFRPRPGGAGASKGTTSHQLRQYAEATLGGGSLRKVVRLPPGEDENEWLAVNMVDFYNQINLLYGAITEFCSPTSCPEMKATDEFEYLWQDAEHYKRPTKMPAPAYIEQLMSWVQANIDDESVLPSRIGVPFPKTFPGLVRQIFKRMYRVYAHVYCHHYPVVRELGLEPHLNTSFKQYVLFIDEHGLATGKDFWGPLGDLVDSMLKSD